MMLHICAKILLNVFISGIIHCQNNTDIIGLNDLLCILNLMFSGMIKEMLGKKERKIKRRKSKLKSIDQQIRFIDQNLPCKCI